VSNVLKVCDAHVGVYCPWLCGCRCNTRMKKMYIPHGCWWLAIVSRAAGYASGMREIVRLTLSCGDCVRCAVRMLTVDCCFRCI